jgi:mRNA interferase MazF
VQDDRFDATGSVTVCAFTGDPTDAPLFRLVIQPEATNVLRDVSRVMVGKVTTVPRTKVGDRIGRLFDEDMIRLNRTLLVFLGLAG